MPRAVRGPSRAWSPAAAPGGDTGALGVVLTQHLEARHTRQRVDCQGSLQGCQHLSEEDRAVVQKGQQNGGFQAFRRTRGSCHPFGAGRLAYCMSLHEVVGLVSSTLTKRRCAREARQLMRHRAVSLCSLFVRWSVALAGTCTWLD